MKLNPDAPSPAEIIRLMTSSENLPNKVGGGASALVALPPVPRFSLRSATSSVSVVAGW